MMTRRLSLLLWLLATLTAHQPAALAEPADLPVETTEQTSDPAAEQELLHLLDLAGWPAERLGALASRSERTTDDELELLGLALRLRQFEPVLRAAAAQQTGGAVFLSGKLLNLMRVELREEDSRRLGVTEYFLCQIEPTDSPAALVSVLVPSAPRTLSGASDVAGQPVEFHGFRFASGDESQQATSLVVAPRLTWLPRQTDRGLVNFGESVLGGLQFDVGLLDQLLDGRALQAQESKAFYGMLAAVRQTGSRQLARFARGNLQRYATTWLPPEENANHLQTDKHWLKRYAYKWKREHRAKLPTLAETVLLRAAEGHYSVAPLFNDAVAQRGELFVFDGLVRRAIRVDATGSDIAQQLGVDSYYELEIFTKDSQNLPLVFCMLELPEGFPQGESITQDARLAGFFFKRWAYRTREASVGRSGQSIDKRQLAPLLIGRAPIALAPRQGSSTQTEILAGGAFVLALLCIWWMMWRVGCGDRQFDQQIRARLQTEPQPAELKALAEHVHGD